MNTKINKTILYPNIQELIVHFIDCDMIGDLFTVLLNIRRLRINL